MHVSSLSEFNSLDLGNRPLLHNVVILPDGTATWAADPRIAESTPETIPAVDCEVVPEWYPVAFIQIPQPQPPEIFVTVPEFTSTRGLKMAERI
jgi:hypothetical protein